MDSEQLKLARHALGLDKDWARGVSYRNRFIAGEREPVWDKMVEAKYATYDKGVYRLTRLGADLSLFPGESLCPEDFPEGSEYVPPPNI